MALLRKLIGKKGAPVRDFPYGRSCVVTVLSDNFLEYFLVFLFSIKKHNPWFNEEVVIFYNPTLSPLSEDSQDQIRQMYRNVRFLLVDEAPYRRFFPLTPKGLHPSLLKMDLFRMTDMERVICLDVDMLCLGDLKKLLTLDVPFAACPAGKDHVKKDALADTWARTGFNCGMMVIGKEHLTGKTYETLMRSPLVDMPTAEQVLLNKLMKWKRIYCLDHRYNYHAQFFWKGDGKDDKDVKILHFAGGKPLEQPDAQRMKIWFEYREEMRRLSP